MTPEPEVIAESLSVLEQYPVIYGLLAFWGSAMFASLLIVGVVGRMLLVVIERVRGWNR